MYNRQIVEHMFGKPASQLTPDERREYRRLAAAAHYYRYHASNVRLQRQAKRDERVWLMNAIGAPMKCSRCGYNECVAALEFHHTDPRTKDVDTNGVRTVDEAKKCVVLCSNCHRYLHATDPALRGSVESKGGRPRQYNARVETYLRLSGEGEDVLAAYRADCRKP